MPVVVFCQENLNAAKTWTALSQLQLFSGDSRSTTNLEQQGGGFQQMMVTSKAF